MIRFSDSPEVVILASSAYILGNEERMGDHLYTEERAGGPRIDERCPFIQHNCSLSVRYDLNHLQEVSPTPYSAIECNGRKPD